MKYIFYQSTTSFLINYNRLCNTGPQHFISKLYNDVIMGAIASQITSLTIVFSTVYSDADQRKHKSSASLAFVHGIHRGPVNSPHKWPVTRKCFHLMTSSRHFCASDGRALKQWSIFPTIVSYIIHWQFHYVTTVKLFIFFNLNRFWHIYSILIFFTAGRKFIALCPGRWLLSWIPAMACQVLEVMILQYLMMGIY